VTTTVDHGSSDAKSKPPIRIIYSDSNFTVESAVREGADHKRSVANVPLFVDSEMRLVEHACAWMFYLATENGTTPSPRTWATYASRICDWLSTCIMSGWSWQDVNVRHLAAYRDTLLATPMKGERRQNARRSPRSINHYINAIKSFYSWAHRRGYTETDPFAYARIALAWSSRREIIGGTSRDADFIHLPESKEFPNWLSASELSRLKSCLNARDNLMADWSSMTGARRFEVVSLRSDDLPSLEQLGACQKPLWPMTLNITKGAKPRKIYPNLSLIRRTIQYCQEHRELAAARGLMTHAEIFLTRDGRPVSPKRFTTNVSRACAKAGIRSKVHALRHTFAMRTLDLLIRFRINEVIDPLFVIKVLLGHDSIKSSEIYTVGKTEAAIEEIMQKLFAVTPN